MKNLLKLGRCTKPHGIKGEFCFHLVNSNESCLKKGIDIFLKPLSDESTLSKEGELYTIKSIRFGRKTLVELTGVENRNQVEDLIPFTISVDRSLLPKAQNQAYYLSDLVGLKVIDETASFIGVIENFYSNGAQDILVIKSASEGHEDFDLLHIEQFIVKVDFDKSEVHIKMPEFL